MLRPSTDLLHVYKRAGFEVRLAGQCTEALVHMAISAARDITLEANEGGHPQSREFERLRRVMNAGELAELFETTDLQISYEEQFEWALSALVTAVRLELAAI